MEATDFDAERPRLMAIAARILGSEADADDVLQETWVRLSRTDGIDDVPAWLTTVVTRLCLDQLRKRRTRSAAETETAAHSTPVDPEADALLAEKMGSAMQVVLDALVPAERATTRAKLLEVRAGDRTETALVDVAVSTERHVGARAVWDPATVTQLFCAFAEPDAIGLSSVLGQLSPVARHEPHGVTARLSADAPRQVLAPIAPGLVVPVGVHEIQAMHPGAVHSVDARAGVIAVDGERELTFGPGEQPAVRLRADGPRCVDIPAVLAASARLGLLRRTPMPPGSTV